MNPLNYSNNIRYAEILYSQAVANQNNMSSLELARKYFSHALVLIDDVKDKKAAVNVPKALWGLLKTCQTIEKTASKEDARNDTIIQITKERLAQLYSTNTDMNIRKLTSMQ